MQNCFWIWIFLHHKFRSGEGGRGNWRGRGSKRLVQKMTTNHFLEWSNSVRHLVLFLVLIDPLMLGLVLLCIRTLPSMKKRPPAEFFFFINLKKIIMIFIAIVI